MRWSCLVLLIAMASLLFPPSEPLHADEQKRSTASSRVSQASGPIDAKELEGFVDGMMAAQREAYHLAGATFSAVQDGNLILSKGYGYANVEQRTPVVPGETLFRTDSVSKLFVWTAVMQLVEQGKLDLNADVNNYLDEFKIPATYPQPVTMANLMSHTAGFEERAMGTITRDAREVQALGEYLSQNIPARARPPGQLTAYSNYGAALAGYIVSQVSGMPFEQYVEENIFGPLEMRRCTFRQPLPSELSPALAVGYSYSGGVHQPHAAIGDQLSPAASLACTATDMANFMIAHLRDGRFGATSVLQTSTAQQMHRQSFTNDPRVSGFAHGFSEATINDQRIIWHGGDSFYFHSALVLLPEHNVGFFVSYNSDSGVSAVMETIRAFMDRYYPAGSAGPRAEAPAGDLTPYTGVYRPARSEYTSLGKVVSLLASIAVTQTDSGGLAVSGGVPRLDSAYYEIAPMVFRSEGVTSSVLGDLVFRAGPQGRAEYLLQQNNPTTAYIRAQWYEELIFNAALLGLCLLAFLSVIVWMPIGYWVKKRFHEERPLPARLASWLAGLVSVLGLGFVIVLGLLFSNPEVVFGLPPWSRFLFALPLAITVGAIGMAAFAAIGWARRYWSLPGRIHYTLVTLAAIAFVGWLAYWNFLPAAL